MGKRPALWAFATASLLVISSAALRAQGLAPSSLDLGSHDQKKADDMVQVITQKSAPSATDMPIKAVTKKRAPVTSRKPKPLVDKEPAEVAAKEPTQTAAKEPARTVARESGRTFAMDPVRPMGQQSVTHTTQPYSRFSLKTPGGKNESIPVITQYYPNQIVYPYGKIDRHIDSRLMQAATIAQESGLCSCMARPAALAMSSSARGTVSLVISVRKRRRVVLCWAFTPSCKSPTFEYRRPTKSAPRANSALNNLPDYKLVGSVCDPGRII